MEAQEGERRWISYEFHDRVTQPLVSAFHQLQGLTHLEDLPPKTRRGVVQANRLVRHSLRELRDVMDELHSPVLDDVDTAELMAAELRQFKTQTGLQVSLNDDAAAGLPARVKKPLYRVFQEATTNARKHAKNATKLDVTLRLRNGDAVLVVRDDGEGFDVEAQLRKKRVGGLWSMRWRAEMVGGTFDVISEPGGGTAVTLAVPISENRVAGGGRP